MTRRQAAVAARRLALVETARCQSSAFALRRAAAEARSAKQARDDAELEVQARLLEWTRLVEGGTRTLDLTQFAASHLRQGEQLAHERRRACRAADLAQDKAQESHALRTVREDLALQRARAARGDLIKRLTKIALEEAEECHSRKARRA